MDYCAERDTLKTDAKRKLHDIIEFVNTTTTEVRTAVATFTSTPLIPILAKIAVAAAKKAERSDHVSQVMAPKVSWASRMEIAASSRSRPDLLRI
jgi:hypothetical protein